MPLLFLGIPLWGWIAGGTAAAAIAVASYRIYESFVTTDSGDALNAFKESDPSSYAKLLANGFTEQTLGDVLGMWRYNVLHYGFAYSDLTNLPGVIARGFNTFPNAVAIKTFMMLFMASVKFNDYPQVLDYMRGVLGKGERFDVASRGWLNPLQSTDYYDTSVADPNSQHHDEMPTDPLSGILTLAKIGLGVYVASQVLASIKILKKG